MSHANQLRQVIEVAIARMQHQVVLENECREPHIVGRDRRALRPELAVDGRVVVGRLIVRVEDVYSFLEQEAAERPLVLAVALAERETGAQLGHDDERKDDGVGDLDERDRLADPLAEIDVAIGIECDPQRQRSSSTTS